MSADFPLISPSSRGGSAPNPLTQNNPPNENPTTEKTKRIQPKLTQTQLTPEEKGNAFLERRKAANWREGTPLKKDPILDPYDATFGSTSPRRAARRTNQIAPETIGISPRSPQRMDTQRKKASDVFAGLVEQLGKIGESNTDQESGVTNNPPVPADESDTDGTAPQVQGLTSRISRFVPKILTTILTTLKKTPTPAHHEEDAATLKELNSELSKLRQLKGRVTPLKSLTTANVKNAPRTSPIQKQEIEAFGLFELDEKAQKGFIHICDEILSTETTFSNNLELMLKLQLGDTSKITKRLSPKNRKLFQESLKILFENKNIEKLYTFSQSVVHNLTPYKDQASLSYVSAVTTSLKIPPEIINAFVKCSFATSLLTKSLEGKDKQQKLENMSLWKNFVKTTLGNTETIKDSTFFLPTGTFSPIIQRVLKYPLFAKTLEKNATDLAKRQIENDSKILPQQENFTKTLTAFSERMGNVATELNDGVRLEEIMETIARAKAINGKLVFIKNKIEVVPRGFTSKLNSRTTQEGKAQDEAVAILTKGINLLAKQIAEGATNTQLETTHEEYVSSLKDLLNLKRTKS